MHIANGEETLFHCGRNVILPDTLYINFMLERIKADLLINF